MFTILSEACIGKETTIFLLFPQREMQAMILAAGLGTRLLPFTNSVPKPLFPILNRPLLLMTIERLQKAGFDRIVVNCHHLRKQIVDSLADKKGIIIQEEEIIMGTGGALRLALRDFNDEPILVTNGDIYHTIDYLLLYRWHLHGDGGATLAMHDFPRFNKVSVTGDAIEGFDGEDAESLLAFTGLHVVNPDIVGTIPPGKPYSIIDCYKELLRRNGKIQAYRTDGNYWTDMGTVGDYLALHGGLLTGTVPWWEELGRKPKSPYFLDDEACCDNSVRMTDWVCMGKAEIGGNTDLRRVVIWDGASIPPESDLKDTLIAR